MVDTRSTPSSYRDSSLLLLLLWLISIQRKTKSSKHLQGPERTRRYVYRAYNETEGCAGGGGEGIRDGTHNNYCPVCLSVSSRRRHSGRRTVSQAIIDEIGNQWGTRDQDRLLRRHVENWIHGISAWK